MLAFVTEVHIIFKPRINYAYEKGKDESCFVSSFVRN